MALSLSTLDFILGPPAVAHKRPLPPSSAHVAAPVSWSDLTSMVSEKGSKGAKRRRVAPADSRPSSAAATSQPKSNLNAQAQAKVTAVLIRNFLSVGAWNDLKLSGPNEIDNAAAVLGLGRAFRTTPDRPTTDCAPSTSAPACNPSGNREILVTHPRVTSHVSVELSQGRKRSFKGCWVAFPG